jgi:hypothetical protein
MSFEKYQLGSVNHGISFGCWLNEVRFGSEASRKDQRSARILGDSDREREREAREEVRVVGGGSCVDCCCPKDSSLKERGSYVQTVQPRNPHQTSQPLNSMASGNMKAHGASALFRDWRRGRASMRCRYLPRSRRRSVRRVRGQRLDLSP